MRQRWASEDLVGTWTLTADELALVANKAGATRLGFAVLLRFFGVWPALEPVLTRLINWKLIANQYDQMIRYATAIRLRTAETDTILRRFTPGPV